MRILSPVLLATLLLGGAVGAHAQSRGSHMPNNNSNDAIVFSEPGPANLLDSARALLAAGRAAEAQATLEAAEHRMISYSLARNLPDPAMAERLRAAVPVVDQARQALARRDLAAANAAIIAARSGL